MGSYDENALYLFLTISYSLVLLIRKFEEKIVSDIENLNKEELFEVHKVKKYKSRNRDADQILDLIDGYDIAEIAIESIAIIPFMQDSWEGRVFKFSKYFNNPEIKERILISCKTNFSNYYFTVLFYKDNWLLDLIKTLIFGILYLGISKKVQIMLCLKLIRL